MRNRAFSGVISGMWLILAGSACAISAPCWEPGAQVQPEKAAAPKDFASAEELLAALESADRGLGRLTAEVEYTKIFVMGGDVHKRMGNLFFASDPASPGAPEGTPDHRRFAVVFKQFYRDDRLEEDPQSYAFDGQWLMEKHPDEKTFHLRQVVRPGETFDPLKIGQGPFPLPIGQRKDDILAEYDAVLRPASDGLTLEDPENATDAERQQADALITDVKDCWQVRLTPKAGRGAESDFAELRLWYKSGEEGRLLPRLARTVAAVGGPEQKGDISLVHLINVKVNEGAKIDEAVFDVRRPDGWEGVVDELPQPGGAARPGR